MAAICVEWWSLEEIANSRRWGEGGFIKLGRYGGGGGVVQISLYYTDLILYNS